MRIRPERVAHMLRRELADILEHRMRDPRISRWVSVIDVEVSRDLSVARVFVSIMESDDERGQTLNLLTKAAPYIRGQLAPRLDLREVPELRFMLDDSLDRGARVNELLSRLERGEVIPDEDLE